MHGNEAHNNELRKWYNQYPGLLFGLDENSDEIQLIEYVLILKD